MKNYHTATGSSHLGKVLLLVFLCSILFIISCQKPEEAPSSVEKKESTPTYKVHIGAILPMTGPAAQYGKWVHQGMEIGLAEAKSKYPNVDISISYEDSQGSPKNAVGIFQKFTSEDVNVVFVLTSGETLAIAPLAEKFNLLIITGTLIPGVTEKSSLLIRNAANMSTETRVMAEYLSSKSPKPKVAVIYVNNEVGSFSKDRFQKLYEQAGGVITGAEAYMPGATDFRAQLTKLSEHKPDILYFLSYSEWATIVKQVRELGMTWQFAGATPTEDTKALKIAGNAAEGTIYTKAAFDPAAHDEAIQSFQYQYKQKYGDSSEVYAATFRDNLMLIATAASKGHTKGKELVDAIISIGTFDGASGKTEFLSSRDVNKPIAIFKIEDQKFSPLEE